MGWGKGRDKGMISACPYADISKVRAVGVVGADPDARWTPSRGQSPWVMRKGKRNGSLARFFGPA